MAPSYDNTIIYWLEDPYLTQTILKTAKDLLITPLKAEKVEDISTIPYFFAIIDGKNLTTTSINILKALLTNENSQEIAILLTTIPDITIHHAIRKYFILPSEEITQDWLKATIANKRRDIYRRKRDKRKYDKTLFRTVYILKTLMKKDAVLRIDDLCTKFNVTQASIKRDITLLNDMGEEIVYDSQKQGYILKFSLIEYGFESK